MTRKATAKARRKELTLMQVADMFRDEDAARDWVASQRWPDGPHCPKCGSVNVQAWIRHKTMTHRCRDCATGKSKTMFSTRVGTVMEGSNLKYRAWAAGIYLFATNIRGVSSMRLHRELGIGRQAAWFMLRRLRLAFEAEAGIRVDPPAPAAPTPEDRAMTREAKRRKLRKPRTITLPEQDYRPSKEERKKEYDMPGASLKTIRRAFFRPFNIRREGAD